MTKILFSICCLYMLTASAQQKKADSLLLLIQQHPANDTTRLRLLCELSYELYASDPVKGLLYADSAIRLGNQFPAIAMKGQAYRSRGMNYWTRSDFGLALRSYDTAVIIFQQTKDTIGIASAYNNIGVTFKSMGDAPKALEYYFQALRLFDQFKSNKKAADVLMNIALVYNSLSEYEKALDYFNKSAQSANGFNNDLFHANLWSNMGSTYDYMDSTEQALEYYNKAGNLYQQLGNTAGYANNLFNIGIVYLYTDQYQEALPYLQKAASLYLQTGNKNNYSLLCYELANLYTNADQSLLTANGIAASKRKELVLENINKGIEYAKAAGSLDRKASGLQMLSNYYEDSKQFSKALAIYKSYQDTKDSIYQQTKKQAINKQELLYEFDKKEALTKAEHDKKQALAQAEIKQQQTIRNAVIAGTAILLLSAGLLFFSYKKRRDALEQQKEAEFNAQVSDTEMKALRSQMNPHFIFNSLNSVNDYIDKNDTGTASGYITKFAKLMRMILENSEQKEVTLEDDLKALELYMQLEALRLKNKFTYEIKVDENIDCENTLVPPLILQPFVENSIWHGIAKKDGPGKINIHIRKEEGMITCTVEDNGIGRAKSSAAKSAYGSEERRSLGMKITNARIDILNKIKKSKAGIELTDLAEGLKVEVRLPLELAF
ncbi:MAG TPA: tetratricopeptide repeat protein [Panacibacter sp.]|nr:tetratricopeptide repeat protein [Panacibacter sp.]HNP44799.1 tetratricopeptide repeat protein [Panacibacter sp.]